MNLIKDKIGKSYFIFLASAIGSTLVTTIYTTVDLICVGHYAGPVGSAAISCINPLWPIMIAPGVLAGVGGSVMMANRKGAGSPKEGNEYFTVAFLLTILLSVAVCLSYIFFPSELLSFFGAEGEVLRLGVEYMKSVAIASPAFTLCACLASFLRNDGNAIVPTVATVMGGLTNVVLDILLVFDFGAGLGVFGAGLATSIGQLVAFSIIFSHLFTKRSRLKLVLPTKALKKLLMTVFVGFPAFVLEMSFGVTTAAYNVVIIDLFGETELAIYGALACVLAMFYCVLNATGVALQPLAAANFGAERFDRVRRSSGLALLSALVIGAVFMLLSQLFPGEILKIYMSVNDQVMEVGPAIVRKYTAGVVFAGISIVISYYLQSVLKQTASLAISLLRGMLMPIVFLFLLPAIFSIDAIWWSVPLAELITFLVAGILLLVADRELKAPSDPLL